LGSVEDAAERAVPDGESRFIASTIDRIAEVPAYKWDDLAGNDNPFVSHALLCALETSGSATSRTGWLPQHLLLENDGKLIGAVPLYLKGHSQGEYVFDHGWAHAYERAGGDYYPKLQASVPFSPVPGPRLLAGDGPGSDDVRRTLLSALETICERMGVSSVHLTFCARNDWQMAGGAGWIQRMGQQFHWHNRGYGDFDDFLGALVSRKRKAIRKERRAVAEAGITVSALTGAEIQPRHWDAFFEFYTSTYDRKWGLPYLTRAFFDEAQQTMGEQVVLIIAERDGRSIAGALNFRGKDALFGRNWGCAEDHRFLHFECCYYKAIEYAIDHGLARVEAGTQGPHKIQRGYLPSPTYSAHFIPDRAFRRAVEDFCAEEREMVADDIDAYGEHSPYRDDGGD
jgi:predicted N-acyltransferase